MVLWWARSVTSRTPSLLESRTGSRNAAPPAVAVGPVAGLEVGAGEELSDVQPATSKAPIATTARTGARHPRASMEPPTLGLLVLPIHAARDVTGRQSG